MRDAVALVSDADQRPAGGLAMSTLASRPISIRSRLTLGHLRLDVHTLRTWLNEPSKHGPTPIAGYMHGLLLRPVDRPKHY